MANVMVVDDEESVRKLFKDILSDSGHVIIEAANGEEAVEVIKEMSVDLVVTDLVMPEKSGLELIMDIAENHPGMPIIAISGGGGITGRFD
ncbi:MAG: response regulator, partial [Gammaproteobacteria bacterium]|nr:response regulator [Gammaproteobacteria bacterium]